MGGCDGSPASDGVGVGGSVSPPAGYRIGVPVGAGEAVGQPVGSGALGALEAVGPAVVGPLLGGR